MKIKLGMTGWLAWLALCLAGLLWTAPAHADETCNSP